MKFHWNIYMYILYILIQKFIFTKFKNFISYESKWWCEIWQIYSLLAWLFSFHLMWKLVDLGSYLQYITWTFIKNRFVKPGNLFSNDSLDLSIYHWVSWKVYNVVYDLVNDIYNVFQMRKANSFPNVLLMNLAEKYTNDFQKYNEWKANNTSLVKEMSYFPIFWKSDIWKEYLTELWFDFNLQIRYLVNEYFLKMIKKMAMSPFETLSICLWMKTNSLQVTLGSRTTNILGNFETWIQYWMLLVKACILICQGITYCKSLKGNYLR